MHELSLAMSLIEEVEGIVKREGASKVNRVSVSIGEISGVDKEAFEWAFPMAAEGTILEKTELLIKEERALIRCRACSEESNPEIPALLCPGCNSTEIEIVSGREFLISEMEVE